MSDPFALVQFAETIPAGKSANVRLLKYFALIFGTGLQIRMDGRGGGAVDLPLNFVFGDGESDLGNAQVVNANGVQMAFKLITSSRRFSADALAGTQNVQITGSNVTLPIDGAVHGEDAAGVAPTSNPVLVGGTDGALVRTKLLDASGRAIVVGGAASGAAPAGNPVLVAGWDTANVQRLATTTAGQVRVISEASANNGASQHRKRAAATNNATNVKATSGKLYGVHVSNPSGAVRYLKIYNKATAPDPTIPDTPIMTILVPAGGTVEQNWGVGISLGVGIGYLMVQGEADNDNTACAAGDLHLTLVYV